MVVITVYGTRLICSLVEINYLCTRKFVMEHTESREGRKRLSMDIPTEIQEKIEQRCKKRNITITKFILQAILEKLRNEQYYE